MKEFAIMRMAKIKDKRGVTMALQHNNRDRIPSNSDTERAKKNRFLGGSTAESLVRFNDLLPEKHRKDAVLAVELVLTASPDWIGDWNAYLNACDRWAMKIFGIDPDKTDKRPLIHIAHHFDESTPHSHIIIMPKKDGVLNAKYFIGGKPNRMVELQDDFFETVGKPFGLKRGIPKAETRARHTAHNLSDLKKKEQAIATEKNELKESEKEIRAEFTKMAADIEARETKLAAAMAQITAAKKEIAEARADIFNVVNDLDTNGKLAYAATVPLKGANLTKTETNAYWQRMVAGQKELGEKNIKEIKGSRPIATNALTNSLTTGGHHL